MTLFVSPDDAPTSAASTSSTSRPEPSSTTVSRCASPSRETMSTTSVSPSRAGPVAGGDELRDRLAQRVELLHDELLGHLGLGPADLELRPVDDVDLRLHRHGRRELPVAVLRGRELVVVLRLRDGPDARPRGGVPEPAADVAVDRLGHDPLLAETLLEHGIGTLPGRKPGIFTDSARSDVACSTAWWTSWAGTSTFSRTVSPPSSSTCAVIGPFKQRPRGPSRALAPARRRAARSRRAARGPARSTSTPDRRAAQST